MKPRTFENSKPCGVCVCVYAYVCPMKIRGQLVALPLHHVDPGCGTPGLRLRPVPLPAEPSLWPHERLHRKSLRMSSLPLSTKEMALIYRMIK